MQRTWLTAHSGCDSTKDNSMAFLQYAMGLEVDCIEVDVRQDAAGILILSHDEGPADAYLADAFAMLSGRHGMKINCDLKEDGLENRVYALAREFEVQEQLVFSGCVSAEAAEQNPRLFMHADWFLNIENLFPHVKTLYQAGEADTDTVIHIADGLERFINAYAVRCLNTHYFIVHTPLYAELMMRDIPLSLWTPDDERLICRLLADGVFNITTRNAKRACELAGRSLAKGGIA